MPSAAQVDAAVVAFTMLADPTRLRLLWLLGASDYDVTTLARLTDAPIAATSQHLAKLRLTGLVKARREGRRQIYAARDSHVRDLVREALHHADHKTSGHPDHL